METTAYFFSGLNGMPPHLGDILALLVALESFGKKYNKIYNITGLLWDEYGKYSSNLYGDILSNFDFKYVQYVDKVEKEIKVDVWYLLRFWDDNCNHFEAMKHLLEVFFDEQEKVELVFPKCLLLHEPGNYVVVQLDCRGPDRAAQFSLEEWSRMRSTLIELGSKIEIRVVGGKDTWEYLGAECNFKYCLGDFNYILKNIFNAKYIITSVSGISNIVQMSNEMPNMTIFVANFLYEKTKRQYYRGTVELMENFTKEYLWSKFNL
jgi:hypothetical protein